jgi:outer membrane biosynthesis protein TonB
MTRFLQRGQSLRALAAALLLAGNATLPAVAALPQQQRLHTEASLPSARGQGLLLAEKEDDQKKKKKAEQQKQPQKQQQKQHAQPQKNNDKQSVDRNKTDRTKQSDPARTDTKKTDSHKKTDSQKSDTHKSDQKKKANSSSQDPQPSQPKITNKQRDKFYEEGRKDGLKQGRERGYDKGFDEGKRKGKDQAYRKAQRKQWESWNRDQWKHYNKSRRNIWITPVQYNRPFYGNPGWAQNSNWGNNRPWGGGWYNSSSPSWSWWGGQALGWGINALTTALIVNNAVNNAIRERQPTVVVPNSSMQLYFGSVEARDETDVTFMVTNGNYTYQMNADCEDGLLNGEVPTSLAEAELVNTACQVAFGSV